MNFSGKPHPIARARAGDYHRFIVGSPLTVLPVAHRSSPYALVGAVLFGFLIGCGDRSSPPASDAPERSEEPDGPPWFEDVTEKVGLNFVHDPGDVSQYRMYQCVGSGCAIADLDGDGRPDLVLLTNAGPESKSTNKLYRQKPDGTFEDVSAGSGLDFPGQNMGIAIGDLNNDGRPDVVVTQVNGVRVLLNQGGMKFVDVTAESGVKNPMWGASVALFDYDRDGWLDIFIVNYVDYDPSWPCTSATGGRDYCAPVVFHGTASKLFRNLGATLGATEPAKNADPKKPRAAFEDVTVKSRIGERAGPGLGVAVFDVDGDGWPDVFVSNDGKPNHLWINQRDGTFAEQATSRGVALTMTGHAYAGMGVALGDFDNDGLFDLYVTHLTSETNTLWRQNPRGQFSDASAAWGLTATRWRGTGFGTLAADFDNDGFLDIAVANGRVQRAPDAREKPGLAAHWVPYGERNQVFANAGGKFRDVSHNNPALCGHYTVARGLACGDIDGDGGLDLLVNAVGEKARLLRCVAPNRGHWVAVRAIDPEHGKRDAIGAQITAVTGTARRVRTIASSDSYLSAGPAVAHFGLGAAPAVDSFEVVWPDGTRERFAGRPADRAYELHKGTGAK
jgi:hypothetical protein